MLRLPFLAFRLFFSRPKLFLLGLFPGVFTTVASFGLIYLLGRRLFEDHTAWLVIPVLVVSLLLLWLLIGKLALLPVEDAIVDECQQALWGEVRLPSPPLTIKRLARESLIATLVTIGSLGLLVLSLVPLLTPFEFVFTCWIASYSFLSTIYVRRVESARGRLTLFFGHPFGHFLLGAFLYFLLFIPVVNVFLLGYAQILAALVYFHQEEPGWRSRLAGVQS